MHHILAISSSVTFSVVFLCFGFCLHVLFMSKSNPSFHFVQLTSSNLKGHSTNFTHKGQCTSHRQRQSQAELVKTVV